MNKEYIKSNCYYKVKEKWYLKTLSKKELIRFIEVLFEILEEEGICKDE